MSDPADALTTMQEAFVRRYVAQGFKGAKAAALAAGYSEASAHNAGANVLCSPVVRRAVDDAKEALRQELQDELLGEAEKSIAVLAEILDNEKAPASVRLRAAVEILEKAGIVTTQKVEETSTQTVDDGYGDLTTEELEERLAILKQMSALMDGDSQRGNGDE